MSEGGVHRDIQLERVEGDLADDGKAAFTRCLVLHFTPDEDIDGCALDCNFMEAEVPERASDHDTVALDDDLALGRVVAFDGDGAGEGEPGVIDAEPHVLKIGSVHRGPNLAFSYGGVDQVDNIVDRDRGQRGL